MRSLYTAPARRPAGLLSAALLALVLLAAGPSARAQAAYQPEFDADAVAVRADDGANARVDVYTKIPYQSLRFLRTDEGFAARYTVSVDVYQTDPEGRPQGLALSRMWERTVEAPSYEVTQSDTLFDFATQALELAAGYYALEVQVEDGASNRQFVRDLPLEIASFARPVAMSGLLLADRYDEAGRVLSPNVSNIIGTDQEDFTVFYEVYAQQPQRLRVQYEVRKQRPERQRPAMLRRLLGLSEKEEAPRDGINVTESIDVAAGRNPATLTVDTEQLEVGEYVFTVRLQNEAGQTLASAEKPFAVRWMGLHDQVSDLESAIAQLRYIAKDGELRAIRNAPTPQEQFRLFREFWDKRDPTPGTRRNERMEEYYYRVAYANRNYGRFSTDNGWNTDRGEVYIRFGEPDFVENHPFNYGTKPYQIWYYNRLGRRFIFVDETGFGDYELLVPIWDDRTRM